ncbi:MAG: 3-deoxy-8-phosphooctulonate synthase [Candidatus Delongbacteria bacterium]|nr:3-deoxy-8-phosphooctulonate synthase [Candidatus Delongbacteria bacterium]
MTLKKNEKDKLLSKIFNKNSNLFFIAGPCVIESEDITFIIAEELFKISKKLKADIIFKASYTKANRSSIESFTGPGIIEGLKILTEIKKEFKFPILTDVHSTIEAKIAGKTVDIIQIPAFLCRQTDLILSAAKTGKIVNIKKGQFASAKEMKLAAEKVLSSGNNKIMLTERGTTFGYNNLVVDFRNFMEMKSFGYPVIYDVTHSLQRPTGDGIVSGGQPEYAIQMASAAISTGCVDGLFIETHPDPSTALSDGKSMLNIDLMEELISRVQKLNKLK